MLGSPTPWENLLKKEPKFRKPKMDEIVGVGRSNNTYTFGIVIEDNIPGVAIATQIS